MDFVRFTQKATAFLQECEENYILPEDALRADLAGLKLYDAPVFGVAAADSPMFESFRKEGVVHPEMLLPVDWLEGAKSVLSCFLPFTEEVRASNRNAGEASAEWMHARVEGAITQNVFGKYLCALLEEEGYRAVFPMKDARFHMIRPFVSNWSERHVAYACGLGTFGISRGLITEKGMAGRFVSIVTTAELPETKHAYQTPFEACILCGKCAENCPANAIDLSKGVIDGKDQTKCKTFLHETTLQPEGRIKRSHYGCGKCQVNVPCESGIPLRSLIGTER